MKKITYGLSIVMVLIIGTLLSPSYTKANMGAEIISEFSKALESQLKNTVHYYHENSGIVLDSMFKSKADIIKIIETDDPDTPENEEVIEEYQADIGVAFVEYQQKRDSIFFFKNTELYYYDLENDEFLTSSNVFLNNEVKDFFQTYVDDLHKKITTVSSIIVMVMISSLLIVPFSIMVFYQKGTSRNSEFSSDANSFRG